MGISADTATVFRAGSLLPRRRTRTKSTAKSTTKSTACGLEVLPPEIRLHILSLLDIYDLKSIVRSSAVIHAQYRQERGFLLCSAVQNTARKATLDNFVNLRIQQLASGAYDPPPPSWQDWYSPEALQRPRSAVTRLAPDDARMLARILLRSRNLSSLDIVHTIMEHA